MKVCKHCNVPKELNAFGRDKYHRRYGAKDGRNIYCKPCVREKVYAGRDRVKAMHKARAKPAEVTNEVKPRVSRNETVQLKLFVETQIRLLTKNGASRELIRRETKAPWDLVTDVLAELWDRGEVKIKRQGEARIFFLKAA